MRKKASILWMQICLLILILALSSSVYAYSVPRAETPDHKVAFYEFDCYHMEDENGKRSGYGYEMMQSLSQYLQCTFSYIGYDKTAKECEEMLRNGEIDLYTAAKSTAQRREEFAFSTHPAITAKTYMNVKIGNTKVIPGDYSTYEGLKVGLLERHTYNNDFLEFAKQKGFSCEIYYYQTPQELTNALITGRVDAVVNSYIGTPEDEQIVEDFGETPYYIMARKEDQDLIDQLDKALDQMNMEDPNWRTVLFNKYYGAEEASTELMPEEKELLSQLQQEHTVIRAVMNPDGKPYSWYEDGEARGIAADMFRAVARKLGLSYEILEVSDRTEYMEALSSGDVDIWIDMDCYYEEEGVIKYKMTDPYLTTTVSVLRRRGSSGKVKSLAIVDGNDISVKEILAVTWPDAEVVDAEDNGQCVKEILNGNVDGALLLTYTAQKLAREDVQNRLRVDIVPDVSVNLQMGINAQIDHCFCRIWQKTLKEVSKKNGAEITQAYVEETVIASMGRYLFDHPAYLILLIVIFSMIVFLSLLYIQSIKTKKRQQQIAGELAVALVEAKEANDAKQNFFSKMSHDIRTPLNVVLGMTQIAQKYKYDTPKLENALENIAAEGQYLLVLINSILDVNQLEYGHIDLAKEVFDLAICVEEGVQLLRPLAEKKEQELTLECEQAHCIVVGDSNRFSQIIINIISNAIKYTDVGGRIRVCLECLPDERYRFICQDNGIGMTEEFMEHIFEDYVRAEDSRVSKTQGTGLGMAVVKGFTDLMQGSVRVESKLGEGTIFTVEIPFEKADPEQKKAMLDQGLEKEQEIPFAGRKVLLAEDNELNAQIAEELLKSIGFEVVWAENGKRAVENFRRSQIGEYFAVFMDMQMPVMDGVEATKAIRMSERADHDIPVFAMTANTFASDKKICKEAGMNGYISKPVSIEAIEKSLRGYMIAG